MRRRALLAARKAEESIFPMYITLTQYGDKYYQTLPTPETVALCDYFLENAVQDSGGNFELRLNPGELYIDGVEVLWVSGYAVKGELIASGANWWPSADYYGDWSAIYIYWKDYDYPKGTIIVENDE